MSAADVRVVEPEATVELVRLAAQVLKRMDDEHPAEDTPLAVSFLAIRLEGIAERGVLDAFAVELAQEGAYRGRRLEMHRAFVQLNPGFGPVHSGCWGRVPTETRCQAAAQRRELELSMGQRFARMLPPSSARQGGEAA
jgi:hypothetical protein